jgi:hypothetical protein
MSRLVASRTKRDGKSFVCDYCLHVFTVKSAFDRHVPECNVHAPQRVVYPKAGSTLAWKSPAKTDRVPFVIYADFESFLVPGTSTDLKNAINSHEVSGFCCHTVSKFEEYQTAPTCYSGENVMDHFFKHLFNERDRISKILSINKPMEKLSDEQLKAHNEAVVCNVCDKAFTETNCKIKDHCHLSGSFRQTCCNSCNMQLKPAHMQENKKRSFVMNVVIHNLKGYDAHLILKNFNKYMADKYNDIKVIACNSERYISFSFGCFRFIDSCQFLLASLDELVTNLPPEQFFQTTQWCKYPELMRSKGIYPYEYMTCRERFRETSLPPKESFYSKLTEEEVSDEEYARAQLIWKKFDCKNLQDYHDIYLKSDTILLSDVFEGFRTMSLSTYKLDPVHYLTAPSLSYDALLLTSKVELELISDPEIYLMLENHITGGISMISKRFAKAK